MRIGLVTYEYPPQQGLGGVGSYMFRLAGALGQAGHEVHVIAGPSHLPPVEQPNVHLHRIPAQHILSNANRAMRWLYWRGFARLMNWMHPAIWHWIKWDMASFDAIEQLHAAHPLDLIEVPEHAANGWMAGKIHRWPIILRIHCPWNLFVRVNRFPFNPMHRVLAHLEKQTVATVPDCITVPSRAMQVELSRTWRMRRPPRIVPNFIDVPETAAPLPAEDGVQNIVCIGRIEPLKGQDILVRAFDIVARKHPRARLQIVGPDRWPGRHRFTELLTRLSPDPAIRARIDLLGTIPLGQIPCILRNARMAVIASRGFESFSFAALEAMAYARPLVATHVGAIPELIQPEQNGLIVPPEDPALLASAMDRMLQDRHGSEEFARAGHELARERYHTPRVLPQIMSAYEDGSDYFYQVRSAGAERTAQQWRRALDAARNWAGSREVDFPPSPSFPENAPRVQS